MNNSKVMMKQMYKLKKDQIKRPFLLSIVGIKLGNFYMKNKHITTGPISFVFQKDCIVVPATATVYAQIVSSDFVKAWNTLNPYIDEETGETLVEIPPCIESCKGE
jgi:hypothetical protein